MDAETILLLSLVVFLFSLDIYLLKKYRALSATKRSAIGITGGHLLALKKGISEARPEANAGAGTKPGVIEAAKQHATPAEDNIALRKGQSILTVEAAEKPAVPAPTKTAPRRKRRHRAAK